MWPQQLGSTGQPPQQLPTGQSPQQSPTEQPPQQWSPGQQSQQSWPQQPVEQSRQQQPGQQSWQQPPVQQPYYVPPQSGGAGKVIAIVLGCVVVVALVAVIAVVASNSGSHDSASAHSTSSTTTTDIWAPTTTYSTAPTTPPFDPNTLDDASTDRTPFTADALLAQSFTDAKGVQYNLVGSGPQACIQESDSDNVKNALRQNNCTTNMSGTYIDSAEHILVSVNVLVFPDTVNVNLAYSALKGATQDWAIWCPTTGVGHAACSGDIARATKSQWSLSNHRYFIQATGIYINLTQDSSVEPWVDAAADKAVDVVGPQTH
ncbi:hypothetical protein [Nocardia jiangxiensis]|uniref:PknH-like extracellular domain-containing protein n=1 Tax=Nocardia jiangxiensis TaxID=282685 RepID=A0ABW6S2X2_9NOCA|nr:hypothetical protein [Nocardia jiangxiensis]